MSERREIPLHPGSSGWYAEKLRLASTGDDLAFKNLMDWDAPRLVNFATGIFHGRPNAREDASDVLQEVELKIHRNLHRIKPETYRNYLMTMMHNECISFFRREREIGRA